MPDVQRYLDRIDEARIRRAKELSEIKVKLGSGSSPDPELIFSKSVVVLSYACWEGFYNECVGVYIDFLHDIEIKIVDAGWMLLTGALTASFKSLRDRNHSDEAQIDFVKRLKEYLECNFIKFDKTIVMSKSNLDFAKLSTNFELMNMSFDAFQSRRLRIDKELVGWRHGVAHGGSPDLSSVDAGAHVNFTADLLLLISDAFQSAMVERA